jgi:hypothetical protein
MVRSIELEPAGIEELLPIRIDERYVDEAYWLWLA